MRVAGGVAKTCAVGVTLFSVGGAANTSIGVGDFSLDVNGELLESGGERRVGFVAGLTKLATFSFKVG